MNNIIEDILKSKFKERVYLLTEKNRNDKHIMSILIRTNLGNIKYLSRKLKDDPSFLIECLQYKVDYEDVNSIDARIAFDAISPRLKLQIKSRYSLQSIIESLNKVVSRDNTILLEDKLNSELESKPYTKKIKI